MSEDGSDAQPAAALAAGLGAGLAAALAVAERDAAKATQMCYELFARYPAVPDGPAGRLLERITGVTGPSVEALVAGLAPADNLVAVLTSRALAERGAAAVPALHAALAALPIPAAADGPRWWEGETAKYRVMCALRWIGPAAAPTVPLLIAALLDEHAYRDTRYQAKVTLRAIGRPAVVAVAAELRRTLASVHTRHAGLDAAWALVDVLGGLPPDALRDVRDLDEARAALARSRPELAAILDEASRQREG